MRVFVIAYDDIFLTLFQIFVYQLKLIPCISVVMAMYVV